MNRERLLSTLAVFLLRLIFCTVRLEMDDPRGLFHKIAGRPLLLCFWHNRILGITLAFLRKYPSERGGVVVLTSPSRDGEILARVMDQLGMGSVRGSSSRRGARALRELVASVSDGRDVAITPDGPRGPRYQLGPGVLLLSQTTGAPILPLTASFSRSLRMKTWDGFIIPLPFSTISVRLLDLVDVPPDLDESEFEQWRLQLETLLKNEAD